MPKILVIDDEKEIRNLILIALQGAGYEALEAENGNVGLELARQHKPDMILCDIVMPGLSGFEMLSALRSDNSIKNIPLVFLTGITDSFSKSRGAELDMDGFLEKPVGLDQLLGMVRLTLKKAVEKKAKKQP